MSYPVLRLREGHDRRLRGGSPWLFSNEVQMDQASKGLEPGSLVRIVASDGKGMATAQFNPHSLIAARILTRKTDAVIDQRFLERRLRRALAIRARLFESPFYRVVHAEADGLPGLVVDRFDDVLVVQINTAGMARLETELVAALEAVLRPATILLRNDSGARAQEGLAEEVRLAKGSLDGPIPVVEAGLAFWADPLRGQKTGWFFDQRANRRFAARLARDGEMLDLYSYAGGFGLAALAGGARSALLVDSSETALGLAAKAAEDQGRAASVTCLRADVFEAIGKLHDEKRRFAAIIADPPPFARTRKDLPTALKGYQKLARGCAGLVAEGGFLCIACCSHNVPEEEFLKQVYAGIRAGGRGASLLHRAGADADHPVHPALPESAYLKFLAFALD